MKVYQDFKNKAKEAFAARKYLAALQYYSFALNAFQEIHFKSPQTKEKESHQLKMLAMLSDMALEHEEEAKALFEYYQVIKVNRDKKAEITILELIKNFDQNIFEISEAIKGFQDSEVESSDGILYRDFKELSDKVGFKEAFEDLMFSSKIIFTNKEDFLVFIQNLVKNGFEEIAINYFENIGITIFYDQEFMKMYKKILLQGNKK
ncbi:MAG: hypothetical protein J1E31_01005 [Helicobacter sp.]|nr:hypothetical protein [Helicobacter sp.]